MCAFGYEKDIQTIVRRQKLMKLFIRIFNDITTKSEKIQEIDIDICSCVINFLAKATFKNKKNQDYFLKKKGHEIMKGMIATAQDIHLYNGACALLSNCCISTDSRLLLWCAGIV